MERERQAADRCAGCSHAGLMDGGMRRDEGREQYRFSRQIVER